MEPQREVTEGDGGGRGCVCDWQSENRKRLDSLIVNGSCEREAG